MLPPQGNIVLQRAHLSAVALDAGSLHRYRIVRPDAAQPEQDFRQQSAGIGFQLLQHRIPVLQQLLLSGNRLPAGHRALQILGKSLDPFLNPVPQPVRLNQQYQVRLKPVQY